ncbi:raffinose/stachyose/melibiose transport system substrate-binding protein [Paenibacillus shirakamiensis]|uniref:Raffinose/stachyose/melibiose transport system substrate-binding protein n=1 Tax=Paenibacillus shirakamiensis TaxID=1265935 RepID=A0ABS4JIJ8_9BACL|nr:extracellular solute-binding protein [Paenibacillus shirakamiensis]MBP2001517.1 raffinose/stachyose/melibiose transport system substrate-binding protein [Paenibacillus shirakamiensis]
MILNSKKMIGVALTGALTLSLTACGGTDTKTTDSGSATTGDKSTDKKVTISFQNIYPDPTTPSYKMLHSIVDQYQKDHPNVTIELDTLNTDQQKMKLKTQAASKEVPDITIVNPAAQMKPFVDAKLLAPLNDMLDQNGLKDTYQKGLLDNYSFDGNTYAVPDGNNIEVVYYNKELFQQAGIAKTPTTFDELLQDVKALKAKGITPIAIGEKDSWTGSFLFMNILLRTYGGPGFLKDVVDGKKTFNDPAFTLAVDRFQDLVQAGAFPDGATSIDYNAGGNIFKTGKAAMYIMGTWETGSIDASSVASKVAAFQFPTVDGKGDVNQYMLAPGSAFAVSANSEHVQETKDFLNYFALNLPKKQFEYKNAVGLGQKIDGDLKASGYSDLAISVAGLFNNISGGDLAFDNTMNPATAQAHLGSIQNLFVQKVDAVQVAKEHQSAFEANK